VNINHILFRDSVLLFLSFDQADICLKYVYQHSDENVPV